MFTEEERERYSRHLVLPEVGEEGQRRLSEARVLVVGAGGLGSPVCFYLAAAGVGKIGIVDHDVVSLSNLQRQIIFSMHDHGRRKSDVAREKILALNPSINVISYSDRLDASNAQGVLNEYDIVADCSDNFPTRFLVNDACVLSGKPCVYGSVFQFEGQVAIFGAETGPCYRCVYPTPPPSELVQDCGQSGVLGAVPGIIGSLQANEIIKLILQRGNPLIGRMLVVDALSAQIDELQIPKDPACPLCGTHRTITALVEYDELCNGTDSPDDITVTELKRRLDSGEHVMLLDVREPAESRLCSIGGTLIPLGQLDSRLGELDSSSEVVVYCHHGMRSRIAAAMLKRSGFRKVKNLEGGIDAWARQVDPAMACY